MIPRVMNPGQDTLHMDFVRREFRQRQSLLGSHKDVEASKADVPSLHGAPAEVRATKTTRQLLRRSFGRDTRAPWYDLGMGERIVPSREAKADYNADGTRVVSEATDEKPALALAPLTTAAKPKKNRAAISLGRKSGKSGGLPRAVSLKRRPAVGDRQEGRTARWGLKDE
jgi:hypothetical protein